MDLMGKANSPFWNPQATPLRGGVFLGDQVMWIGGLTPEEMTDVLEPIIVILGRINTLQGTELTNPTWGSSENHRLKSGKRDEIC